MKRITLALSLLLFIAAPLFSQSVKLPAEVKGDPGEWIVIVPEKVDGGDPKWIIPTTLQQVPVDKLFPGGKVNGIVVKGRAGTHTVIAYNAKGDVASDPVKCKVIIGDAPDPGPDPGPNPPVPPTPAPIQGKRCLIIEETEDRTVIPAKQRIALDSEALWSYLDSHTEMESDGKHKAWRIWDKDVNTQYESKTWQDALAKFKTPTDPKVVPKTPWIIVSNGKTGYEGPLPGTLEEIMALVKKYLD